jgi:hypothetical protein
VNQLIISYSLSRNCTQQFEISKTKLFLKVIFVKFCTFTKRKFGVMVEVQAGKGANGLSPAEGKFININLFLGGGIYFLFFCTTVQKNL